MDPAALTGILKALIPVVLVVIATVVAEWVGIRLSTRRRALGRGLAFRHQTIMILIAAAGLLGVLLTLPISDVKRGHLFTLTGIAITAIITLSSTTLAGNAMAGLMLRAVRNFGTGDYISVGEVHGRVTEFGLIHTEIQTQSSDLVTLPNLLLVRNPVTVIRESGTFIHATVSLGYDVHHDLVEALLVQAATSIGLEDVFVRILELGDHSVTYRVMGRLTDLTSYLGARTALHRAVLDALHGAGVEIVSPAFQNQRRIAANRTFIPTIEAIPAQEEGAMASPDQVLFEKARAAGEIEALTNRLTALSQGAERLKEEIKKAPPEDHERLESKLQARLDAIDKLQAVITSRRKRMEE